MLLPQSQLGLNDPSFLALYWADVLYIHLQFPILGDRIFGVLLSRMSIQFPILGDRILDVRPNDVSQSLVFVYGVATV